VTGRVSSRFVAAEEVVAYQLAREAVNELIARNATFGALLFSDLGRQAQCARAAQDQHELQSLTLARVDEAYLRPAHTVERSTDIVSVVKLFQAQRTTNVLVTALNTRRNWRRAGHLHQHQRCSAPSWTAARWTSWPWASWPAARWSTVRPSDQLGDAMAAAAAPRVHRVVVGEDDGQVRGILEALDLFSFLSNHSHLITVQIEHAQDLEAHWPGRAHGSRG
jgi:CBS domain-containing protein